MRKGCLVVYADFECGCYDCTREEWYKMTTDAIIQNLRTMAATKYALEKRVLTEAADRLEEMDERIALMGEPPAVRCRECKWYDKGSNEVDSWARCSRMRVDVYDDFYCEAGERMMTK